jgi:hypothetical protein
MAKEKQSGSNYVSEWFGQRIYPIVRAETEALQGDKALVCPFLSEVLADKTQCVKAKKTSSAGVCTVSSVSNGSRQDWLVCPYRVISSDIVRQGCTRIFGLDHDVLPMAVPLLRNPEKLELLKQTIDEHGTGYIFFQDKLGGEISITSTAKSPELSFDVTIIEIKADGKGGYEVARYGILEIQTMDYHGSYRAAVSKLRAALDLHPRNFPQMLALSLEEWAGAGMEGPNVANVFKRTFYQMLVKFRLAGEAPAAAGTILALPKSVWDSWQPFLGAPTLEEESPGLFRLKPEDGAAAEPVLNSYICVFDLDATAPSTVSPVKILHYVRVSPERLAHHAFTQVPETIMKSIRDEVSVMLRIRTRLGYWWRGFSPAKSQNPRIKAKKQPLT